MTTNIEYLKLVDVLFSIIYIVIIGLIVYLIKIFEYKNDLNNKEQE